MVVGLLQLSIRLPESHSLKEKRWALKSLVTRIRNKFNVSVAEVNCHDAWQAALLGVVQVGNDQVQVNRVLNKIADFAEGVHTIELVDTKLEFF